MEQLPSRCPEISPGLVLLLRPHEPGERWILDGVPFLAWWRCYNCLIPLLILNLAPLRIKIPSRGSTGAFITIFSGNFSLALSRQRPFRCFRRPGDTERLGKPPRLAAYPGNVH